MDTKSGHVGDQCLLIISIVRNGLDVAGDSNGDEQKQAATFDFWRAF